MGVSHSLLLYHFSSTTGLLAAVHLACEQREREHLAGLIPERHRIDVVGDGRRFRWGSHRGGVGQSVDHVVTATSERSCTVALSSTMTGPLGAVLGRLGAVKIRSMVDAEEQGLPDTLASTAS